MTHGSKKVDHSDLVIVLIDVNQMCLHVKIGYVNWRQNKPTIVYRQDRWQTLGAKFKKILKYNPAYDLIPKHEPA